MPFLPPNQQRQSTEGNQLTRVVPDKRLLKQLNSCMCVCLCVSLKHPAYPGSPRQKVVKATKQLYVCVCVFHCVSEKLRDIAVWNTV